MTRVHSIVACIVAGLSIFLFWQLTVTLKLADAPAFLFNNPGHGGPNAADATADGEYLLGVGKADITGPVVELNMMGYADMDQVGTGLRQRLYCRAFIIGSISEPADRIVYLVLDTQSGDTAIRHGILQGLGQLGTEFSSYTKDNVAVTGTHSHAGPGAWVNYLLPQITSKGFDKSSYQAIVDGSLRAIQRAHRSLVAGHLSIGVSQLDGININRSPYAYDANPKDEKSRYQSNVDKTVTVLRFDRAVDNQPIGVLSWFAVHGTSLYGNNTLIAGDNKGVAANLFERHMAPTNPGFVAAFSQANVGDSSPSVLGAFCEDTGFPCRYNDSTCDGNIKTCRGRGPYFNVPDQGTKSCFEIGRRQFAGVEALFRSQSSLHRLSDPSIISSLHTFVDLSSYAFPSPRNQSILLKTCSAALGHSFAGGTFDGPGAFDFKQGTTNDSNAPSQRNPLWKVARAFVHEPSAAQKECQNPKPILLDVGAATLPYAWSPNIVDIQLLRVGNLIMIISPGEATTMSGRRWREALAQAASSVLGISPGPFVVLGGPANSYTHYITTEEEYSAQRYEGASTLYGPHTLNAYISLTRSYLPYLAMPRSKREPLLPGTQPPINTNNSLSFITPVIMDQPPLFKSFGDVLASPDPANKRIYRPGETVETKFVGANPRNNLRLEGTFVAIEKLREEPGMSRGRGGNDSVAGQLWDVVRTDADWNLVYRWKRTSTLLGTSEVSVEWEIEDQEGVGIPVVEEGLYRARYFGDAKKITGTIEAFEGTGGVFEVGRRG